jgi:hypothetical protein
VIVTFVLRLTALVVMPKVALVLPLGTTTVGGVCAAAVLLLDTVTVAPPVGAWPLSVTVPVEAVPPNTLLGFTLIAEIVAVPPPPPYTAW